LLDLEVSGRLERPTRVVARESAEYRYLFLCLELRAHIHLLYFYGKGEQDDLSDDEKEVIRALVDQAKQVA